MGSSVARNDRHLSLSFLVGFLVCVLASPSCKPIDKPSIPLSVGIGGCWDLWIDEAPRTGDLPELVCSLGPPESPVPKDPKQPLWVRSISEASLFVTAQPAGKNLVAADAKLSVRGERALSISVPPGTRELLVRVDSAKDGTHRSLRVRFEPVPLAPWLQDARLKWILGGSEKDADKSRALQDAAQKTIVDKLAQPIDTTTKARALSILLKMELKRAELDPSKNDLPLFVRQAEEALRLSKESRLVSRAAQNAIELANALSQEFALLAQADSVLTANESYLAYDPNRLIEAKLLRARFAYDRDDLAQSMELYRKTIELGNELETNPQFMELRKARYQELSQRLLPIENDKSPSINRRTPQDVEAGLSQKEAAVALDNYTWVLLRAEEDGLRADEDPLPFLERALKLHEENHASPAELANTHINFGRALLAAAALGKLPLREAALRATEHAQSARKFGVQRGSRLEAELLFVEARSALGREDPTAALALYAALQKVAPPHSLFAWFAAAGLAEAHQQKGDVAEALDWHEKADHLVDLMVAEIPLGMGRHRFLIPFERSTARHLELLLPAITKGEAGRAQDAFALFRRVRSRLLRVSNPLAIDAKDLGQRQAWEADKAEYRKQRRSVEEYIEKNRRTGQDDANFWREVRERNLATLEPLAHALRIPLEQARATLSVHDDDFSPPKDHEILLGCYPLLAQWVCMASDGQQVEVAYFDGPSKDHSLQQMGDRIVQRFSKKLGAAESIRFLPYGALQALNLGGCALDGVPLLARKNLHIEYAIDPPRSWFLPSAANSQGNRLTFLYDSRSSLLRAERALPELWPGILQLGYKPLLLFGPNNIGSAQPLTASTAVLGSAPIEKLPALGKNALFAIEQSRAWILFDHIHFVYQAGWASGLLLDEGTTLTSGDILTASSVPELVLLLGCKTDQTDQDGTADEIGLVSALLLRGTRVVLASSQTLRFDDTVKILRTLLAQPALMGKTPNLQEALEATVRTLRTQGILDAQLGALRIYKR